MSFLISLLLSYTYVIECFPLESWLYANLAIKNFFDSNLWLWHNFLIIWSGFEWWQIIWWFIRNSFHTWILRWIFSVFSALFNLRMAFISIVGLFIELRRVPLFLVVKWVSSREFKNLTSTDQISDPRFLIATMKASVHNQQIQKSQDKIKPKLSIFTLTQPTVLLNQKLINWSKARIAHTAKNESFNKF